MSARSLILALALGVLCGAVYAAATPPKPIQTQAPEYPKEEEDAGHGGRVVLKFSVSETGAVENVEVATSTGFPKLDEAALAAARNWKFEPAKDEAGKAVAGERSMALSFKAPDPGPVFPETCAELTAKVAAYRAQDPQGELGKMDAFSATTGLFFLKSASKPMEVRLAMVKDLNAMYPDVAARCAAKPDAKYMDIVLEAFDSLIQRGT
jgi:TonB family protein